MNGRCSPFDRPVLSEAEGLSNYQAVVPPSRQIICPVI